jgi:hypothetical protein
MAAMKKTEIRYVYRGPVERGTGRGYRWHDGYSANSSTGGVQYPWMTKREAQSNAKAQGARAMFVRAQESSTKRHHSTKKSPAQLQREIDKALSPETHLKSQRAHATVKTEVSSTTDLPLKDKLQLAAKWIRREIKKRDDGSHPSHLAAKVLEEADEKFNLGSYGVEGWAKSPSRGYQYLNYGDPYDATIVVRSNPTQATVFVALGGWATYAGSGE